MYIVFVIYEYTINQGWLHQISQADFFSVNMYWQISTSNGSKIGRVYAVARETGP